ncbi:MAG: hypothetical protein R2739_07290 [Chitinophagales bacterium]|nr:hypothetical protein [Bacteroidota bacterium]
MRIKYFPLFLILISSSLETFCKAIPLQDAIVKKMVHCTITGNDASIHYLEPIIIAVENKGNQTLQLTINSGDLFIPNDEKRQNIIATQAELIVLKPNEKIQKKIRGMCTEQSDMSGNSSIHYSIRPSKNDTLTELANFIAANKFQSAAGQLAVWTIADNSDINTVFSADSTEQEILKKYLAQLTGKTFAVKTNDYKTNYYAPPKSKVSGSIEFNFLDTKDVQVAMFNENGILVREIYNQKNIPPGKHTFQFSYDGSIYTDDIYHIKLIAGMDVMVDRVWDVKAMRDALIKKIEDKN